MTTGALGQGVLPEMKPSASVLNNNVLQIQEWAC